MANNVKIPYNEAGKHAFDIMWGIAERIWETARTTTADYISEAMPDALTLDERSEGGTYYRTLSGPDGKQAVISYDYRTKAITILTEKEARRCRRTSAPAASVTGY